MAGGKKKDEAPKEKPEKKGWFSSKKKQPKKLEATEEPPAAEAESLRVEPVKKKKETHRQRQKRLSRAANAKYTEVMSKHEARVKRGFVECEQCLELAFERSCCGADLCDHCYCNYCPSCGIGVVDQKPMAETKQDTAGDPTIDDEVEQYSELSAKRDRARQMAAEVLQELMECRLCLNPGEKRTCCMEVFCDDCYNASPKCPSCHQLAARRGLANFDFKDPGFFAVFSAWCCSVWLVLILLSLVIVAVFTERADLQTLHGYTCYGFFPRCDRLRCVDLGSSSLTMPNMATWRDCEKSTEVRLVGSTCVFDQDLFIQSGRRMGYDFCVGSNSAEQSSQLDGDENPSASFTDGVYVLAEDFDGNSSNWAASLTGGQVDDECGWHSPTTDYGRALHFFGAEFREVVTRPLDLTYGGQLTFRLKLAPVSDNPRCISNFGAAVSAFYRVDANWVKIRDFENDGFDGKDFTIASVAFPPGAWTNSTELKISQPAFSRESDHWAIDDFSVFHKFKPGWKSEPEFEETLLDSREDVGVAQCCMATDQCEIPQNKKPKSDRKNAEFTKGCDDVRKKMVKGYKNRQLLKRGIVRINGAQFYISLAGLALLYNFLYWLVKTYLTKPGAVGKALCLPGFCCQEAEKKKNVKIHIDDEEDDEEEEYDETLKQTFEVDVDVQWQKKFARLTIPPFILAFLFALSRSEAWILYTPLKGWGLNLRAGAIWIVPVPEVAILILATYLDLKVLYGVLRYNVCFLERWIPMVQVNTDPMVNALDVFTGDVVDLSLKMTSLEEMSRFERKDAVIIAGSYVFVCMPFALLALCMDALKFNYDGVDRVVSASLGAMAILRAWCGRDFLVKFGLGILYLADSSVRCRKRLGKALCDKRTKWIAFYTVFFVTLTGMTLMPMDQSGQVTTRKVEFLQGFALVLLFAILYGTFAGVIQSLPVTPEFRLTKLGGGLYFTFADRPKCPCVERLKECTTMHSRRKIIVLYLEDEQAFVAKLKGHSDGEFQQD